MYEKLHEKSFAQKRQTFSSNMIMQMHPTWLPAIFLKVAILWRGQMNPTFHPTKMLDRMLYSFALAFTLLNERSVQITFRSTFRWVTRSWPNKKLWMKSLQTPRRKRYFELIFVEIITRLDIHFLKMGFRP